MMVPLRALVDSVDSTSFNPELILVVPWGFRGTMFLVSLMAVIISNQIPHLCHGEIHGLHAQIALLPVDLAKNVMVPLRMYVHTVSKEHYPAAVRRSLDS
jgi:hypothetical protein